MWGNCEKAVIVLGIADFLKHFQIIFSMYAIITTLSLAVFHGYMLKTYLPLLNAKCHKSTQNTAGNQAEWDRRKSRSDLFFSPQNAHFQKTNQPKPKQKAKNQQPKPTNKQISPQNPTETEKTKSSQAKVTLNNFWKMSYYIKLFKKIINMC